jgi:hypothetical protein
MSKPITINDVKIDQSLTGAMPFVVRIALSDGQTEEMVFSRSVTEEYRAKTIANRVVELNQTAYWHPLTPGLVHALIKFRRAVIENDGRPVHIRKDMAGKSYELTPLQWNNFTKLRFHGLAVKMGNGRWQLHWRASGFLRGEIQLPQRVKTENNTVIDHDDVLVTVDQVMEGDRYWDTVKTLERERVPARAEPTQVGLGI